MKTAVIYKSPHHGNTRRVAEAIGTALGAPIWTVEEAATIEGGQFDLIGFGSGIYFGRHHHTLRQLVANWPSMPPKAFVFSTAGIAFLAHWWHGSLIHLIRRRGCQVIGEFCCPGWDTVGPLSLIGGIQRGRPNDLDLARAASFAAGLH